MDCSKFTVRRLLTVAFLVAYLVDESDTFGEALHKTRLDGHDTHDMDFFVEHKLSYVHAKIDMQPTIDGLTVLEKMKYRLEKNGGGRPGESFGKEHFGAHNKN